MKHISDRQSPFPSKYNKASSDIFIRRGYVWAQQMWLCLASQSTGRSRRTDFRSDGWSVGRRFPVIRLVFESARLRMIVDHRTNGQSLYYIFIPAAPEFPCFAGGCRMQTPARFSLSRSHRTCSTFYMAFDHVIVPENIFCAL